MLNLRPVRTIVADAKRDLHELIMDRDQFRENLPSWDYRQEQYYEKEISNKRALIRRYTPYVIANNVK